ncbi:MAG: CHAT domain-containing protein, partial [Candidatus Krumholzibacteriia bacterium]
MRRNTVIALVCLLIWAASPPNAVASKVLFAAEDDSLKIALSMANRCESCVAAFSLATRQLPKDLNSRADLLATAEVFRTLANIARDGGDVGTSMVFSEAGLLLAKELLGENSPALGSYELIYALAMRLSGWPNGQLLAANLVESAINRLGEDDRSAPHTLAGLQQARANFTRAARNYPKAIVQYEVAINTRLQESPVHTYSVVDNEVWRAHAVLKSGDLDRARRLFEHCRQDLLDLGLAEHHLMASTISSLATISQLEGDNATATVLYGQAYARLSRAQKSIFPGFSQRRLESPILNLVTYLALEQGDDATAWLSFSEMHNNDGYQIEALKKARELDPDLAKAVHLAVARATNMIDELEVALQKMRLGSDPTQERLRSLEVIRNYAYALSESFTLRDQLRSQYSESRSNAKSFAQLQERLNANQAFLGYFVASVPDPSQPNARVKTIYAVVVRESGPAIWTMVQQPNAELSANNKSLLWTYTNLINKASEWPTRLPQDAKVSRLLNELHDIYFAPIAAQLAGSKEVFLLSTGIPGALSFPAMIGKSGQSLVDKFVFQNMKGIDDVGSTVTDETTHQALSLVLGDPAYTKSDNDNNNDDPNLKTALSTYSHTVLPRSLVDGVLNDGEAGLARLPRLYNSGWEARGIASMTAPVVLLTGEMATEQKLYQYCGGSQPQSFKWIHLATHALVHLSIPERSALALAPSDGQGLLFVEEIGFGWALNCELITLSGCQTGSGLGSRTAGRLGFIQALQTAGARNLLLSTSKVDDIATALLMERFYANISNRSSPRVNPAENAPMPYSFALAEAQRWIRD